MQPPELEQAEPKDNIWSHIDQAAILRLQQLDHDIDASHQALRHQLEELVAALTREPAVAAERGLQRLLLILEHSSHLTRQSIALIDERHALLRW